MSANLDFKLGKNCHMFRCLRCWHYILPSDNVQAEGAGYVHAICKERKFTIALKKAKPHKPKKFCKGICKKYRSKRGYTVGYSEGHKRCRRCNVMMKYRRRHCPCCGMALRTKPQRRKNE